MTWLKTSAGQAYTIIQFVADERLRAAAEHGDEELVAVGSRGYRAVALVDHLEDHEIFHEMHPPVVLALGGKAAAFGGRVLVEDSLTPGLYSASPRFLCQHLRAGEHGTWPDLQASGKLLICQDTRHGGVGNQHLRLPGIETLDDDFDRPARG